MDMHASGLSEPLSLHIAPEVWDRYFKGAKKGQKKKKKKKRKGLQTKLSSTAQAVDGVYDIDDPLPRHVNCSVKAEKEGELVSCAEVVAAATEDSMVVGMDVTGCKFMAVRPACFQHASLFDNACVWLDAVRP